MEEKYSSADSFQSSRIHHHFITKDHGFEMGIISADNGASNVSISKIQAPSNITDFMPGMYVACIYDDDWFVGNVIEISEQYNEIHVKFMKKMENAFCGPLKMINVGFLCSTAWDMLSLYCFKETVHIPIQF